MNSVWFRNPGSLVAGDWGKFVYTQTWGWSDVSIDVSDINGDSKPDIILTPAEADGGKYRVSWFESGDVVESVWEEHVIDKNVESVLHSLVASGFDNDGDIDVLTAEMHQSKNNGEIVLYKNSLHGLSWEKEILAKGGLHNLVAVDIDGDFDIDFMGTNWRNVDRAEDYPVKLWINKTNNVEWKKYLLSNQWEQYLYLYLQ